MITLVDLQEGIGGDLEHGTLAYFAYDQEWDSDTIQELKDKYHIIFFQNDSIEPYYAFKIIDKDTIAIGFEDDGTLYFPVKILDLDNEKYDYITTIYSCWLEDLIAGLGGVREFIKSKYSK